MPHFVMPGQVKPLVTWKRTWAVGTIVHVAVVQEGIKQHRPFLVSCPSKGILQVFLAPFQVKICRDRFDLAIPSFYSLP